ncbi:VQ motif-containing protein 22 [Raphanus sativus]|uniref:VQ motif-containing protein 22 n=1 Tax=Raphanus sativus TaxID=3726 RepID=A0A9W3BT94_RAPSA|nr:VQ motif-containing protein 22 [Raphanus sativus]XP_056842533.1 VQ motif-containing protein 22 [Raphanus sativus]XP_056842534.1 VQ motif-containing protein 22 [Raphanus sativus]XP_056842535.1 VQ motif-containing protein 22 [Raphanus sativus]KAJ4894274.1 VQ motif-containing protein 22 [Raphanus sativus]
MANSNDWSHLYGNNQAFYTTSTITSTAVTTTTAASPSGEATSMDSRLSPETGRVTKPARRRSRASRRTPTTLLNTDTSNFRAMVQQFTGGPSAMAFGSGNTTSGFSLTSSSDPSAGSSQQVPWQYSYQPHAPPPPQQPYMFSLNNMNPVVGYSNMNNPNMSNPNTVVSGVFGTADGGSGGSAPSYKEATNSNTSSSRLQ